MCLYSFIVPRTPPDFVEPLVDQTAAQGERVEFHCQISGDPKPNVKWYKDGDEIFLGRHIFR